MYKCEECGATFDEYMTRDYDGEILGFCPECDSENFQEAVKCEGCGEWLLPDEVFGYDHHFCRDCIDEYKYDLPVLLRATDDDVQIDIPVLYQYILGDDINDVLKKEVERRLEITTRKCLPHVEFVPDDFIDDYKNDIADAIGADAVGEEG